MTDHVYKLVELTGTSTTSIEDAVQKAIQRVSKTITNLSWFQVVETRGNIDNGQVHYWQVTIQFDLNMIYISGPGHGGPAIVGNTYLEGTYSEVYPEITQDEAGLKKLFKQFSFPGGIPSHVSPECPGSIHEGGEHGLDMPEVRNWKWEPTHE